MTEKRYQHYIGIDVSKDKLDIYLLPEEKHYQTANNAKSIKAFFAKINKKSLIVMEASGGYERFCAQTCQSLDFATAVVNPKLVYHFRLSKNQFAKTDKLDARILAYYAKEHQENIRHIKTTKTQRALMDMYAGYGQLKKSLLQMKNRRSTTHNKVVQKHFDGVIKSLEKQLKSLEQKMIALIEVDNKAHQNYKLIQSIPGVGSKMAITIIAALPEITQLKDKALHRLVGVAPMANDSGKFKGKRFIQGGRQPVRNALYMSALVASRHHKTIRVYYLKKLAEGKEKKSALVGCMAKLLRMIRSVIQNQRQFVMPEIT